MISMYENPNFAPAGHNKNNKVVYMIQASESR